MRNLNVTHRHLGNLASPGDLEESASHHKSADLSRGVLECSLPGGFTLLKWFPLGPPRTKCVSLCKTRHSRAEVLIPVTVRVGVGSSQGDARLFVYKTNAFCVRPWELKLLHL